jgi:ElaB/YqjD/DUF883 family membrane-anchored ribosome-binding protein
MPGAEGRRASRRAAKAVGEAARDAGGVIASQALAVAAEMVEAAREAAPGLKKQARRLVEDRAQAVKSQSRDAANVAGEQLEAARAYVVERVQERPFTTSLAVLGAGFLLGMLVAGRRK